MSKTVSRVSVSMANSYISCPMKYFGLYQLKIKQPKKLSLSFGNWIDDAVTQDYTVKAFSDKDLPLSEVKEIFVAKMESEVDRIEIWDDENKDKNYWKDYGVKGIEVFYKDVCKFVSPEEIQPYLKMTFKDSPIELYGKPDVVEKTETIRDTKTTGRSWEQSKADQSLQPLCYSLFKDGIGMGIHREFYFDILVKLHKPKIQKLKVVVDDVKRKNFLRFINSVVKQIDNSLAENNFPNSAYYRADPLCCHRYCAVANECEKRYHIKIKP
jgi:hypothetical protein